VLFLSLHLIKRAWILMKSSSFATIICSLFVVISSHCYKTIRCPCLATTKLKSNWFASSNCCLIMTLGSTVFFKLYLIWLMMICISLSCFLLCTNE